jgi:hypothetical protein
MTNPAVNDDDDPPPVPGAKVPLTPTTPKQRVLFVIVIILGVLILLALGALVTGFITGATGKRSSSAAPWSQSLDVPAGTRVTRTEADGNRLIVHLTSAAGAEEIVVLDTASGRIVGRVRVKPRQ